MLSKRVPVAGALTVSVLNFNSLTIVPIACTSRGSWLTLLKVWTYPTEVRPECMNNTCDLVSQEFSDRDRVRSKCSTWQQLLSGRHGLNLWRTCTTASLTYVLSKHSVNNKLNNYDVIGTYCTAPSKI